MNGTAVHPFELGEQFTPFDIEVALRELITAQLLLTQSMTDLAESIRALAEAMDEPEPDVMENPDSMVMSRKR